LLDGHFIVTSTHSALRKARIACMLPHISFNCVRYIYESLYSLFFLVSLGGVRLSPLGTSATVGLLYQPRMIDDDYGTVGGMMISRGNCSTRRKPAPVPICPPQIPHDLGSNPGCRGGKPATNRLSYAKANLCIKAISTRITLHLIYLKSTFKIYRHGEI
jgi:hypothetical protein